MLDSRGPVKGGNSQGWRKNNQAIKYSDRFVLCGIGSFFQKKHKTKKLDANLALLEYSVVWSAGERGKLPGDGEKNNQQGN